MISKNESENWLKKGVWVFLNLFFLLLVGLITQKVSQVMGSTITTGEIIISLAIVFTIIAIAFSINALILRSTIVNFINKKNHDCRKIIDDVCSFRETLNNLDTCYDNIELIEKCTSIKNSTMSHSQYLDFEKNIEDSHTIYVATNMYLSEKDDLKNIICSNLSKGIIYHYLIPESASIKANFIHSYNKILTSMSEEQKKKVLEKKLIRYNIVPDSAITVTVIMYNAGKSYQTAIIKTPSLKGENGSTMKSPVLKATEKEAEYFQKYFDAYINKSPFKFINPYKTNEHFDDN